MLIGSTPTDLEIDVSGTYLYAGHLDTLAIAQIDAATMSFVRFITTPRDNHDIAPLGSDRIATIDSDQWTTPTLMDIATGRVLDDVHWGAAVGALAATADGNTLFVGDAAGPVIRYDVSAGKMRQVATSSSTMVGPAVMATPDGSSVYYSGYCLNGANLTETRYRQYDQILSIAPNGNLAVSEHEVYRVSDGTTLTTLPAYCNAEAVSSDSGWLYCAPGIGVLTFDLHGLN